MELPPPSSSPSDTTIIQPLCSIFRRFLKNRGLKFTTERALILDAVLSKDNVFEVDQLLYEMHGQGVRVSKATIYRTIKHLVEAGIIQEVLLDSRQAHYQLIYGRQQKDHIINVDTEATLEFHDEELIERIYAICREHGLDPVGHRLLIYGTDPNRPPESE